MSVTDDESTLTTPMVETSSPDRAMLCFTIVWHPDDTFVGAQFFSSEQQIELGRLTPRFSCVNGDASPLLSKTISRQPIFLQRHKNNDLTLQVSEGKMGVKLNGDDFSGARRITSEAVTEGLMLFLGGAVVLSVTWALMTSQPYLVPSFIGVSQSASRVKRLLRHAATNKNHVLLLGETGTGKEVAAEAIHGLSQQRAIPMVAVNMSSLSDSLAAADLFGAVKGAFTGAVTARLGFFAAAAGTTLLLDEIGNTPPTIQPMLLRVLEKGDYFPVGAHNPERCDARIIAATDQDLQVGGFNPALLRRLEQVVIALPPLRERREDIGVLICHVLEKMPGAQAQDLPASLVYDFCLYSWPGNVRQLIQIVRRALHRREVGESPTLALLLEDTGKKVFHVAREQVDAPKVDHVYRRGNRQRVNLADLPRSLILEKLVENNWNISASAESLGISRPSLYQLKKLYKLNVDQRDEQGSVWRDSSLRTSQ